jgi:hypothetical protein
MRNIPRAARVLFLFMWSLPALAQGPAAQTSPTEPFCNLGVKDLKPGECYCVPTTSAMVSGGCVYQAFAYGTNHFNGLITIANNRLMNAPASGSHINTIFPQQEIDRNRITWYLSDMDSNHALGRALHEADVRWRGSVAQTIHLVTNIYFLHEGYEGKFKLDLEGFLGRRELEKDQQLPGKAVGGIVDGILNGTIGLGNWYRSILNFTLRQVSKGQLLSERSNEFRMSCEEGGRCNFSDVAKLVLVAQTGVEDEDVGLWINGVPIVTSGPAGEPLIQIDRLNFTLSETNPKAEIAASTGAASWSLLSPFRKWDPVQNRSVVLKPGDVYVILNQVADQRMRFSQILGTGNDGGRTHLLITIRALLDNGRGSPAEPAPLEPGAYTPEDLARMDLEKHDFEDVLRSTEIACPDRVVRPGTGEPICLLRLTKLNSRHVNIPLKIKYSGKLGPADQSVVKKTAGELYAGKGGYLTLPRFRQSKHAIQIEIDNENEPAKRIRAAYAGAVGMRFDIGYYPGSGKILFDPAVSSLITE